MLRLRWALLGLCVGILAVLAAYYLLVVRIQPFRNWHR